MTARDDCFLYLHGHRWPCHSGDIIGRDGTLAREALLPVDVLSRRHLSLEYRDGQWWVIALAGSRNETFLDGLPMMRGQAYAIDRLRSLRVDFFEFHLGVSHGSPTQHDLAWSTALGDAAPGSGTSRIPPATDPIPVSQIIEALPTAALETDARLSIIAANNQARQLLGDAIQGRDLDELAAEATNLRSRLLGMNPGDSLYLFEARFRVAGGLRHLELSATRLDEGLLILCRDVTDAHESRGVSSLTTARQARLIETLSELSLEPSFAAGDLAQAFTLLTHRAAAALGCHRVSVWLPTEPPATGARRIMRQACFDLDGATPGGQVTDMAYCPHFFDPLATAEPWAAAEEGSPVLNVLREIGFAAPGTRLLLCVGLPAPSGVPGVLTLERVDEGGSWSTADRQFACCLASFATLAVRTAERREALESLQRSGEQLTAELEEANRYIQRILPEPVIRGPITAEWNLQPSEALGGDSFGYHWVGDLFVMYVLDVVGHGTGMALLSISVLNSVRARLLLGESAMSDPAGVLCALNAAFPMENQNNMLFSMWYGVFDRRTRILTYASAGHPPAILLHGETPQDDEAPDYATLGTEGPSVGALEGVEFSNASIQVQPGSKLFLFTDGAFEFPVAPDREWTFEEFVAVVRSTRFMPQGEAGYLRKRIGSLCAQPQLPDDFTIVRFTFEE